jgi:CheY-like chemotaxis protein
MAHSVLVIDDEPDIRLATRLLLQSAGYSVTEAMSGEEGVALVGELGPDAVLLDLRMPGMDGWGVLERLRADGRLEHLPVIVLSAFADAGTVERAVESGASGYVRKPFESADLTRALEDAFATRSGLDDS